MPNAWTANETVEATIAVVSASWAPSWNARRAGAGTTGAASRLGGGTDAIAWVIGPGGARLRRAI
jgi:hypothetical protein